MEYLNTKTCREVEIDVATATREELLDCYDSLFDRADTGGAFPGSKAWTKAKPYADQLAALTAARPEVIEYRRERAAAARAAKMAGVDIAGI